MNKEEEAIEVIIFRHSMQPSTVWVEAKRHYSTNSAKLTKQAEDTG
jgi:hypothetical protein